MSTRYDQMWKGSAIRVPAEIKGWNWGALLLNWIWAIGNRVWVGLLSIIPVIGLFVMLYLGCKGNELAWQSRNWTDVSDFRKTQKVWGTIGLAAWMITLCVCMLLLALYLYITHTSLVEFLGSYPRNVKFTLEVK